MEIIKRDKYLNVILENISNKNEILFLIGPRQVGKTTLLKSLTYFNYFEEDQIIFLEGNFFYENAIDSFTKFIEYIKLHYNLGNIKLLIIDEAQLVPNLGNILFQFINEIRRGIYDLKLIVSGSGSLQIFKNLTDSLVGRKYILKVFPFDFLEFIKIKGLNPYFSESKVVINEYFKLIKEYWLFGGYPKVVIENDVKKKYYYLKEIYNSVIEKDIRYFLKEQELLNLNKVLFEIVKVLGSQINFSQIVENVGIKRYEFEKIKFILENTFIIYQLNPFVSGVFKKEIKTKNKFYVIDMGILRLILGYSVDNMELFSGKIVENFIFSQIYYNLKDYQEIYFWANHNEVEIDFVLKDLLNNKLICIDAKQRDKDNIPKGYISFCNGLTDKIKEFIITTKYLYKDRKEKCLFKFIPFVLINYLVYENN